MALKNDGTIVTWGNNSFGQTDIPYALALGSTVAIAAGGGHSAALRADGMIFTWGWNDYAQAGTTTPTRTVSNTRTRTATPTITDTPSQTYTATVTDTPTKT